MSVRTRDEQPAWMPDLPTVRYDEDRYTFRWDELRIEIEASRFDEASDGLKCWLLIAQLIPPDKRELIHRTTHNLLAGRTRVSLAKELSEERGDVPWRTMLEQVSFMSVEHFTEGDPPVHIFDVDLADRPKWVLKPYIDWGGPTVLFGPGGTGKSMLGAAMAVALAVKRPLIGEPMAGPMPVMYLDWEADQYAHAERIRAICVGANLKAEPEVYYRRMSASIVQSAAYLRRDIVSKNIGLVIVDSLGAARGDDPEGAGPTIRAMQAIRSLPCAALVIDHVSKSAMETSLKAGKRTSPFGSIYTENLARNTWSVMRQSKEGSDESVLGLIHQKTNNGRYAPRHAFRLNHENDGDRLASVTIQSDTFVEAFEEAATLPSRILAYMQQGHEADSAVEVAKAIGESNKQVSNEMGDLAKRGQLVKLARSGKQQIYGLASNVHRGE